AESFTVFSSRVERHFTASDDTHKLVLRLADDRMIECVLIQDEGRATACISTQVGCGMGCVFCASGLNGVVRNLSVGEIIEQLVRLRNLTPQPPLLRGKGEKEASRFGNVPVSPKANSPSPLGGGGRGVGSSNPLATRLTHIVVMGMGEPLANLD